MAELENLKEGIYYVRKIPNGKQIKWIADFIEDLPKAREVTSLDLYRNRFYQALENLITPDFEITKVMIVNTLFDILEDRRI